MKKLVFLFLAVFLAGTATAQLEGFSAGAEIGVVDFRYTSDSFFHRPVAFYETELGWDIDFSAELGTPFGFGPKAWLGIDWNVKAVYRFEDILDGMLDVSLENWTYLPLGSDTILLTTNTLGGPWMYATKAESYLGPGAKYTRSMDFGEVFAMVETPFVLFQVDGLNPLGWVGFNLTGGVELPSGIGGGLKISNNLRPKVHLFTNMDLFGFYTMDPFFFALDIGIPLFKDGIKNHGITFTPSAVYDFDKNITIFARIPVMRIGSDKDTAFGLTIGGNYEF